jgi:sugar phosphate isomerase/epimerase
MKKSYPLSFQMFSARDTVPLKTQLAELAKLGYENVEPFGALYADPIEFRKELDANGLSALSGHFDLSMLEADTEKAIHIANTLGIEIVIAPWLDPSLRPTDANGWKALGARLAVLQKKFAKAGLTFAWHTHDFEFIRLPDGSFPVEHIFEGNSVGLELDVAWVIRAGADPLVWLEKYSNRLVAVHVKDIAPQGQNLEQDGWADLGVGVVDWKRIWPVVNRAEPRLAVLEHDRPGDWIRFAKNSAAAFRALVSE